ncbi:MAG: ABC transporter ATP-binding protein [Alphaproteobacteria bacterium]|nr:ABC transporter ATP-binding protein [Alphaproteobacteria bacterium]
MTDVVVQSLFKSFGSGDTQTQVLRGVDFTASAGKMTFLVGPSGCGKTTLLSIISAMLRPDQGDVLIFGQNLLRLRKSELTRFRMQEVGFVFQQYNLISSLTSVENASVPLLIQGYSEREAKQRAIQLLLQLGLTNHLSKYPAQLSGGQQQRVAVARALIHQPRLVVCDEPTASLDADAGAAVMTLLKSIAVQPDRSVIVVSHDSRVYSYADQISEMADGRIIKNTTGSTSPHLEIMP